MTGIGTYISNVSLSTHRKWRKCPNRIKLSLVWENTLEEDTGGKTKNNTQGRTQERGHKKRKNREDKAPKKLITHNTKK